MHLPEKKIAIVADWLIDFGGAELVISHLLELYPEADIYTSVCYMEHPMLEGRRVYTSWIQRIPFFNHHHKLAGLLRPWAFRNFDLSGYDIVICSSSAESKQVVMGKWNRKQNPSNLLSTPGGPLSSFHSDSPFQGGIEQITNHQPPITICYCHTPTRYYWSHAKEYEDIMEFGILNPLVKGVFRLVKGWMQKVDYVAAQRVDFFIANSRTTQERIKTYYGRESEVIYPGVAVSKIENRKLAIAKPRSDEAQSRIRDTTTIDSIHDSRFTIHEYYLGLGRCIPYKRFDLLVDAFNTNGKKLILCTATDTSLFRELKAKSKPNIEWRFRVSNEKKRELMASAKAFLFPPEEDFGLVPVEAMMYGAPVIAYGKGGATESVVDGETGLFFSPQTPEAMNEAIEQFEKIDWDRSQIQERGMEFSKERFQEKIIDFITKRIHSSLGDKLI